MSLSDPPLFPCLECQARGRPRQEFQLRDLEEHLCREHFGISYYFCPKCKQDFVTKAKVSEHIKTVCKLERIPQTEEFTKNILHYDQEVFKLIDRCLTQAIAYRIENPLNQSNLLKNEEKINENGETQPKTKNMVVKQEPREETRQMGPDTIKETAENENSGKETTTPIKQEIPENQEGPEAEKSQEIPQEPVPVQEQLIPVPGPSCLSANLQNLLDIHFSKTFSMPNTEFSEPEPNQTGNGSPMPNIGAPSGQPTSNPGEMGPGTNQMGQPPPQLTLMTSTPLKKAPVGPGARPLAPGSSHSPQPGPRANKMSRMTVSPIQSPSLVPAAPQMGTVSSELPPLGPRANEIAPGPAQACPTGPKGPQSGFGPLSIPHMGPEANQMGQPQPQMTQKARGLSPLQQKGPGVKQAGPAPRPIPTIGAGPPQLTQIDPGPSLRGLEANYLPQMGPGAPPFGPGFPPFEGVFGPPQLGGWPYRPPHSGPGHFKPGTIFLSSMGLSGPYSNPQPSGFPPGPIGHPLSLMPEEARRLLAEISITVPGHSISSKIPGTKGKEPATEGPTAEKASKNSKEPEKEAPVAQNGPNPLVPAESSKKAVKDQPKPANPPEKQDDIVARPTSAAEPAKIKKNRRRTRAAPKARKALKKAKQPETVVVEPPAKKTRKIQNAEKRKQSAVDESPPAKKARKEEPKSAEKSSPVVKYPAKQPVTRPLFEPGYKIPVRRTFILPRPSSSASKELESAVVPSNEKEGSLTAPGPELGISGVECRVPMEEAVAPPQISSVLQKIHLQIPIKPEPFEADPERSPPASPPLEITVPPLGPVFPPTEGGEGGQPSPSSSSRRPRITPPSPERARIHRRISPPTQEFQPRGRSRRGVAVPIFDPELDDLELFDEIGAEEEEISLVDSGQPLPLPIRIGLKVEEDADEMGEQPQDEGREGQEQPRPSPPIPSLLDLPPLGRSISRRVRILPPAGGSRMGAEEEYQNDGYIEEEIVIQFPEHVCEYSNCCSEPHLNHPCPFCNGYHRPSDCATITNIWERKVACFFNQHCIRCLGMHPLLNKTSCKKMTCVHCRMSNHPTALCTAFKNKNYRKTLDKCRELCVLPLSPEIITSVQKRYLNLIKVQPDQWGNPHLIAPHQ